MSDLYPYRRGKDGRRLKVTPLKRTPLKRKIKLKTKKPLLPKERKPYEKPAKRIVYEKIMRSRSLDRSTTDFRGSSAYRDHTKKDFELNDIIAQDRRRYNADGVRHYTCEECGVYLSSPLRKGNFSHYIPKGSAPGLRHVKDNINILCIKCHQDWEFGDRGKMKIYDPDKHSWLKFLERLIEKGIYPKFNPPVQYPQELV